MWSTCVQRHLRLQPERLADAVKLPRGPRSAATAYDPAGPRSRLGITGERCDQPSAPRTSRRWPFCLLSPEPSVVGGSGASWCGSPTIGSASFACILALSLVAASVLLLDAADAVGALGLLAGGVGAPGRAGDDLGGVHHDLAALHGDGEAVQPRGAGPSLYSPT